MNTHSVKFGDRNINSGNITDSFNTTFYNSDQDAKIMHWLSPLEPDNRHHDVRTNRFEGVGDWLLERSEFREWRRSEGGADKAVMFCSGDPGVGKTYLSSLVIDRLCDQARGEDLAVTWLYCDYKAQEEQTVTNMMGAILKRLVGSEIPEDIRKAFKEGRRPLLADLVRMLRKAIASLPRVFICIDALDEFLPKGLPDLLGALRDVVRESPGTRIFLTARPHVGQDIRRHFPGVAAIPVSPDRNDVKNYVKMRLDRDHVQGAMDDGLRREIADIVQDKMSDMFLLVSLTIEAILGEVTIGERRDKLEEMARGNGLSDVYAATLTRLKVQNGNRPALGLKALMWVVYSERPLKVEELCHALEVKIGSEEPNPEKVPAMPVLLESCLGLLIVEASSSTVRLVHFTLKEHFSADPTLLPNSHSTIAEICLTYLNFGSVRNLSPTLDSAPSSMPLLEYASLYWGEHARRGMTGRVKPLALRLLDKFDEHISAHLLLLHHYRWSLYYDRRERGPAGFTELHGAAFHGIVEVVALGLDTKKWDVNVTDCVGSTALMWAARRGHSDVVKALLDQKDINPDGADTKSCPTPLSLAAEGERGEVNPDGADTIFGRTPLLLAAEGGHEGIVRMLLERGSVNPDRAGGAYGRTPLSLAAKNGHEGIVRMLLERGDVNLDQTDTENGRTPLSFAAGSGHEGIVRMLLERGSVSLDRADTGYGWTPLWWAAGSGHEGVVRILLERKDANSDHADTKRCQAPLLWTAEGWREAVVRMLSEREGTDADHAHPRYDQMPLFLAAEKRKEGVVKMLLEREGVSPDHADTLCGQTLLSWAAEKGHEEAVRMLIKRADVNPNQADTKYGRTPLLWAAENGNEGIVKILLKRVDVDPNQADTKYGRTPLMWAAENGHEAIIKIILKRAYINPNRADTKYGRTPLLWAAENGHAAIVKIILKQARVDPNQADTKYGRTPLLWAAANGHAVIVKIILKRARVDPDQADTEYGRTPLSWAAGGGHEVIVRMILERGGVNPDRADTKYGRTPLSWAAENGHEGIVKILLVREEVNPNRADTEYGRMPLSWAAENGHEGVVKILSEWGDVCPTVPDNESQTPLSLAISGGHYGVAIVLQGRDNSDSGKADHSGPQSPSLTPSNENVCAAEMEVGSHNPNTSITNFDGQPASPSLDSENLQAVSSFEDSVPMSLNDDIPATEPSRLPQPSSIWPLKFPYPPWKSDTHPDNTCFALPIAVNRYWVIGSCVCLLSFLAYRKNSHN